MLARIILRTIAATARPAALLPKALGSPGAPLALLRPLYRFAVVTSRTEKEGEQEEEMGSLYEDEKENWSADYRAVIADYPFHHIPVTVIRHPENLKIDPSLLQDLIAFKCLTAREKDLARAYEMLFPETAKYRPFEDSQAAGKQLFSDHFESRIGWCIETINNSSSAVQEKAVAFAILGNMANRRLPKEMIERIDEGGLVKQDKTGVLLASYAFLLCKHERDHSHLFDLLMEKLESADNPVEQRLKMAKIVIGTHRFEQEYPRKLVEASVGLFGSNLQAMANYEIIFTLRQLYPHHSRECKAYAEQLQRHLIQMNQQQEGLDFHIPLTLKTIRFSAKMGVPCEPLLKFITANIKRFKVIFENKNITKGVFFSLLFDKYNKDPSPELVSYLKTFFLETVETLAAAQQADESELIRFNKLLVKFITHLPEADQQYIRAQYLTHILPSFNSSTDVLYYSLLVILRRPFVALSEAKEQQTRREMELARKEIVSFFQRCCTKDNSGRLLVKGMINQVIEILYQVSRHEIDIAPEQLPFVCKYDFSQKETVNPETVSFFFTYLGKDRRYSAEDIREALGSLEPTMEHYLRTNRIFSMKTFYAVLNICARVDFEHKFFYRLLEGSIAHFLITHPDFVIIEKDLKFLNDKLLKRGYGSHGFRELVLGSLESPRNWKQLRSKYTENEKQFMDKLQTKKREHWGNKRKF